MTATAARTAWTAAGPGRTPRPDTFTPRRDVRRGARVLAAGGDTSVAWDTKGNAYLSCQLFNRGRPTTPNPDQSSALYVFRSTGTTARRGTSPAVPWSRTTTRRRGHRARGQAAMTVDNHVGSPFQDRVYVTWTEFAADGTRLHLRVVLGRLRRDFQPRSGQRDSPLCAARLRAAARAGTCNENQFSQPFTGPDGALYVVCANFNNARHAARDNRNQMLLAKSTDGGMTFTAPVKVGDYYDLPDCATYQHANPGRACVPGEGVTATRSSGPPTTRSGAVNPTNPGQVVVTFGSYINKTRTRRTGAPRLASPQYGINLYTGVKIRRCLQQRHPAQCLERRRQDLHRDDDRPAGRADRQPRCPARRRPTSSGNGRRSTTSGRLAGQLLRPAVRQRRDRR